MSWHPQGSTQSEGSQSSGQGSHQRAETVPLYIMNISPDLSEDLIRDMFSQAGNVVRVKCLPLKEGKNSCVGFVDFSTEEDAEKAIAMFNNMRQMNGFTLRVDYSKSFKENRGQSTAKPQSFTSAPQNNNYSMSNGHVHTAPYQPSHDEFQSDSVHSIGRGVHNYNYENSQPQLSSVGRGIHPASQGGNQPGNPQPGMSSYNAMNGAPGIPPGQGYNGYIPTTSIPPQNAGGYNYTPASNPPQGEASYSSTSSAAMAGGSGHPEMNGMVNGVNNMHLSTEDPSHSGSFNQAAYSSQPMGQSFSTNQYQVSSRLPRTQNNSGTNDITCHKCGNAGHFARECPNSSATGGGGNCHECGQSGHFARECPNKPGGSGYGRGGGGDGCHKCGEQGHFARECPKSTGGGGGGNCHECGQPGHFARECPNKSGGGGYGRGGDGCHKCGEQGHFARECPNGEQEGSCPRPAEKVDYVPPDIPDDMDVLFKASVHKGINFDRFDNIPVEVTGSNPPAAISSFDELLLPETLKANLGRADFTKPTPVQKYGVPIILNGRDIMACAQTGSGKTVAFLLPVMAGMVNSRLPETSGSYLSGDAPTPAALCIAPTRELALQIYTEALKFSSGTYLRPVVCYGGVSVQHQLQKLERGCHILIGTPGRLIDFVGRNKVSLTNVRYLILDEADRMLDMGFENDIRKIVGQFGMPEKTQRQTLMFSATFPDEIQKLAREFLNDYLFLAVGSVGGTNLDINQQVVDVDGDKKRSTLVEILGQSGTDKTLVFVERKRNADFLANWLSQNNYPATSISGDRTQKEREDALRDFRNGRAPILIATSVAARGLDIPDVMHVVNYDLPQHIEEYVHRIGRTGRIGNKGKATAFFERRKDDKLARSLVKILSDALQDVPSWLEEVAERALGTSYGPAGGRFASRDTRQFGGGDGNSRQGPSTNVSFANTAPQQGQMTQSTNDEDEEWD